MAAFMRNFKAVNMASNPGAKKNGNMSDFTSPNTHTPAGSTKNQFTMTPKVSGPIKTGKGNPLGSVR